MGRKKSKSSRYSGNNADDNDVQKSGRIHDKDKTDEEQDIGFDLKKITGIFRRFRHDKKSSHKKAYSSDAEESASSQGTEESSQELEFDLSKASVYAKKCLPFVLLLIPIFLAVFLRVQPAYLPQTDDWALNTINSMIRSNIASEINRQYPNLPDTTKNELVNEEFTKLVGSGVITLNSQQIELDAFVEQQSQYFKDAFQKDDTGHTYLLAIDPYYYYRLTKNYIDHGYEQEFMDEDGKYCDMMVKAGEPLELRSCSTKKVSNLHVLVNAWTYRVLHLFNSNADIMMAVFYVPVIIAALSIIPAFFIGRRIAGNFGGLFTSLIVAIHPAFVNRTAGGFSDTDAYNVLFPLVIALFLIEAFYSKDWKRSSVMAAIGGLFVGLYSFSWGGWFFVFDFILVSAIGYIGFLIAVNWKKLLSKRWDVLNNSRLKAGSVAAAVFFISSGIFITLISGFSRFIGFISATKVSTEIKLVGVTKVWPNVFTTVAELNPANLGMTLSQISIGSTTITVNKVLLFVSFLGLLFSLLSFKGNRTRNIVFISSSAVWYLILLGNWSRFNSEHLTYAILLSLPVVAYILYDIYKGESTNIFASLLLVSWFAVTIYASSKGVRFIMLLVPAFAIAAGVTAGVVQRHLSDWISKELNINRMLTATVIGMLLLIVLFLPVNAFQQGYAQAKNEVPSMNDQWYGTLTKISEQASPDAIINSWWDFGHWFAAIGERAVTLDGGRQNNPAAHWLGKLMLTWDQDESVGILRYLDCGNNYGFDVLNRYNNDSLKSINELKEIIPVHDPDLARSILVADGVPDSVASDVLELTHCKAPEDYFITSQDMVGKSGVWAHFGSWDFERASMYNMVYNKKEAEGTRILTEIFGKNSTEAERLYNEIRSADPDQWISTWPSYVSEGSCQVENESISCINSFSARDQSGVVVVFVYNTLINLLDDSVRFTTEVRTSSGNVVDPLKEQNPGALAYISKDGEFKAKRYSSDAATLPNGRPVGFAVYPVGSGFKSVMMDAELTGSIFTRLFYYENIDGGLEHFKVFHKVTDITGQKIIVWKVDWEGTDSTSQDDEADSGADSSGDLAQEGSAQDGSAQDGSGEQAEDSTKEPADGSDSAADGSSADGSSGSESSAEADSADSNVEITLSGNQADEFSRCIADYGALFYGSVNCGHCPQQRFVLGDSEEIPYVDCTAEKERCESDNITAYPTWRIDGKSYLGWLSVDELSGLTGCAIPSRDNTGEDIVITGIEYQTE
ncbi:hypothetical protein JXB31_05915 [Candidatus Woesearchaeota archaeon]|nr:hypothetical protein [Candidatus Woesearchaeota archaeon]